jgi:hypothetical protein
MVMTRQELAEANRKIERLQRKLRDLSDSLREARSDASFFYKESESLRQDLEVERELRLSRARQHNEAQQKLLARISLLSGRPCPECAKRHERELASVAARVSPLALVSYGER